MYSSLTSINIDFGTLYETEAQGFIPTALCSSFLWVSLKETLLVSHAIKLMFFIISTSIFTPEYEGAHCEDGTQWLYNDGVCYRSLQTSNPLTACQNIGVPRAVLHTSSEYRFTFSFDIWYQPYHDMDASNWVVYGKI